MSELGLLLKKARVDKGITLEELQDTTKIRKKYLEAIEEGNYKILPGNFYVRAFIKSYSEAVGLDQEELLHLYRNVIPSANPDHSMDPIRRKPRREPENSDRFLKWASAILMWCFPLLIIGIIYYYFYSSRNDTSNNSNQTKSISEQTKITNDKVSGDASAAPEPSKKAEEQPTATESSPKDQIVVPKQTVTFLKTTNITDTYTAANSSKLEIQLKVTGDECWIQVRRDNASGETIEELTVKNGDAPKIWELDGSAWIKLGRANAAELSINGTIVNTGTEPNPKIIQVILDKS